MSKKRDARIKSKRWLEKAQNKFGLSKKGVRNLMRKAGVKDLDSRNDIQTMNRYIKNRDKPAPAPAPTPAPAPSPEPTPAPTPAPAPAPAPTPTPAATESPYKTLYEDKKEQYDKVSGNLTKAREDIGRYTTKISGYETSIGKYKTDVERLTNQYETAVKGTKTLTTERDDLQKKFDTQTAEFEQMKSEAKADRELSINQQLAGIRGGATAGGSNQTSTGTGGIGDLSSGRTGYSSSKQDRDKGLADYIMEQGGATDSVLNREGPVVQLMGRRDRERAPAQARRGGQSRATGAGTGSYYASRFG